MDKILNIVRTNSDNLDFRALVSLLDQDLAVRDGDEHSFYHQFNAVDALRNVVLAYEDDRAVSCGAFKEFAAGTVEIKRMYTRVDRRGHGLAQQVLAELEKWAVELGYRECVLETGKKQPEAIALYQKSGYALTPNYGQYVGVENSVCMKKSL